MVTFHALSYGACLRVVQDMRPRDRAEIEATRGPLIDEDYAAELAAIEWGVIACSKATPVAILAIRRLNATTANVGLVATDRWPEVAYAVSRFVRDGLPPFMSGNGLRRLQTLSIADYTMAHRYLAHMGFQREGTMRALGESGQDLTIWARVDHGRDNRAVQQAEAAQDAGRI